MHVIVYCVMFTLLFTVVGDGKHVDMHKYILPENIVDIIKERPNIENNKSYIFSFSRFSDFDTKIHGTALVYLFEKTKLIKTVVDEDKTTLTVTYNFDNADDVMKNLNSDVMLFLCAVLHNLDVKTYLLALVELMTEKMNMKFEDILKYSTSGAFNMMVFYK